MKKEMSALDALCVDAEKELRKRGVLSPEDKVCVALSGGADSVALLYTLNKIRVGKVFACHVNHGIRGEEADRDERFCTELCNKLGIQLKVAHIDVPSECRKSGEGLEECARRMRYAELNSAAISFGCAYIATAHHADDNIETVLMHLIRGCGLRGLTGIPYIRDNIIRPLLPFSRERIVKVLESEGIDWVYDSTNSDLEMSRNLIRHTVLPQIYKLNPSADTAFRRMCESVSADEHFIEKNVSEIPLDADRDTLCMLDDSILSRYIRMRYDSFGGTQISGDAVLEIITALRKKGENFKFKLPGKITVYVDASGLAYVKATENKPEQIVYKQRLNFGENIISSCGYKIFITQDKNVAIEWKNIYKLSTWTSGISDKILCDGKLELFVRSRKSGDRYIFGKHERDVRRQLINFKMPEYKRSTLPCIVTQDDEIVFIPGLPVNDGFKGKEIYIVCVDCNLYG